VRVGLFVLFHSNEGGGDDRLPDVGSEYLVNAEVSVELTHGIDGLGNELTARTLSAHI